MGKKDLKLKDILDYILYENPSTQEEIAQNLGISRRYVVQLLKPLIDEGTVKRAYMVDLKKYEEFKENLGTYYSDKKELSNILIEDLIRNMAKHVQKQLETSFNSLLEYDEELANVALEMDFTTNNLVEQIRVSVESMVNMNYNYEFSKFVLYNEVAYDLERIGDYCGHIAKFAANEVFKLNEEILNILKKMYKNAQKMMSSSILAFLENKVNLKEEIMAREDTLHHLQSKAVNLIASEMREINFDQKELSSFFIYLFRVIKAFERIGDISIEISDVAIEFHKNIPRPITPRSFR